MSAPQEPASRLGEANASQAEARPSRGSCGTGCKRILFVLLAIVIVPILVALLLLPALCFAAWWYGRKCYRACCDEPLPADKHWDESTLPERADRDRRFSRANYFNTYITMADGVPQNTPHTSIASIHSSPELPHYGLDALESDSDDTLEDCRSLTPCSHRSCLQTRLAVDVHLPEGVSKLRGDGGRKVGVVLHQVLYLPYTSSVEEVCRLLTCISPRTNTITHTGGWYARPSGEGNSRVGRVVTVVTLCCGGVVLWWLCEVLRWLGRRPGWC